MHSTLLPRSVRDHIHPTRNDLCCRPHDLFSQFVAKPYKVRVLQQLETNHWTIHAPPNLFIMYFHIRLFVGFMNVYWLSYVTGVCICRKIHEETPEQSELICQAYLEVFWASSWKQPRDSLSCRTGQKESFIHPQNNNIWAGCTSGISKQG